MGLPVSKEELAGQPEAPIAARNISSSSQNVPLIALAISVAPAFAALALATALDFAPIDSALKAGIAYFALFASAVTLVRSSLRTRGPLTAPALEPYVASVTICALAMAIAVPAIAIARAPLSSFAAAQALELGAVLAAFALWFELRTFIGTRLAELAQPATGLLPAVAWKKASAEAAEVKSDPETIRPGELCLCKKGDCVPSDGVVERGVAVISERSLSGRAHLRIRGVGEEVYAGSTVLSGEMLHRSSCELKDSRVTSFLDLIRRAGRLDAPFLRALTGPALLSILFVAGCVALGWHELKLSWEQSAVAASSVLACVVLVDMCAVLRALPAIVMSRAFRSGVLFQSVDALAAVSGLRELVIDYSAKDAALGMRIRDFVVLDERLDRPRIESALLSMFSRGGEELASAFEEVIQTPPEKLFPCKLTDYNEYPGLGYSGTVEGAELSVGSEEFLIARGVRMQPSETIPVLPGQQNVYISLGDEVVARFIFADPNLEPLALSLAKRQVQLRLCSIESQESADAFGKRAGIELALIKGGLSIEEYREKLRALKSPGLLANGRTESGIIQEARVAIAAFDPIRWNFERTPITVFGDDPEVAAAVFEHGYRYSVLKKTVTVFGAALTGLLLGLSLLARLTPAAVLVAALSGLTFVILAAEEKSPR